MKLTKAQRATLREMFGGRCAYCGCELGERWHADHVEAVQRKLQYVRGVGFKATGEVWCPENDHIGNLMPACVPCNIDKHSSSLEDWRHGLQRTHEVLRKNASRYRHGLRFGLITENTGPVVFYFERFAAEREAA
jgi:hypothetical protein